MVDFINKFNNTLYKELKVRHLKIIYKVLFGDNPDPETTFINFDTLLNDLTTKTNIETLDFVSYFLLLIEIRMTSIGSTIFANLENSNTKIEFNLTKIKEQLQSIFNKYQNQTHTINNITIVYGLPTINEILYINQQKDIDKFYSCFIKEVITGNTVLNFKKLTIEDKNKIFEQLPAKITSTVIKEVIECISFFNTVNLISYIPQLKNVTLSFNLNITNLVMFLKFLFGDGLLSLYENIIALCKLGNLTPEYIENCTPGEYLLLVKKLEQLNSQTSNQQAPSFEDINDNLDEDLKDLNPYKSPDLPPITSQTDLSNIAP